MDETDILILRALQANARLTIKELAAAVHLSSSPVFERLKRLERTGIIKQYTTVVDAEKLHKGFVVFCNVKLRSMNHDIATAFAHTVGQMPEVAECYNISGSFDYLLKIRVPDMKSYQHFLMWRLGQIEGLASVESTFVMDELKREYGATV